MVQIKFITFGATSAGGSFGPGDVMRCDDTLAEHLVDEAKCAVYVESKLQATSETVKSKVKNNRKRKDD